MDDLKRKYSGLEIEVERLRSDISMAKYKEDRINRSIDTFEEIINYEKSKIAEDELDDLQSMIKRLTRLISTT